MKHVRALKKQRQALDAYIEALEALLEKLK